MSRQIYLTRFDAATLQTEGPSQPVALGTVASARAMMFPGMPAVHEYKKVVTFDVGDGKRVALSDYAMS